MRRRALRPYTRRSAAAAAATPDLRFATQGCRWRRRRCGAVLCVPTRGVPPPPPPHVCPIRAAARRRRTLRLSLARFPRPRLRPRQERSVRATRALRLRASAPPRVDAAPPMLSHTSFALPPVFSSREVSRE